jgi:4-amino-4-deoxy-L-arabinose transferase-like glycosyltransferase
MGTPRREPAGDAGGRFESGPGPDVDGDRRAPPRSPEPPEPVDQRAGASSSRRQHRLVLAVCLLSGAATHAYHLTLYPLYTTDEGIYIQQAWSVLREARLSPYTYFYDHAPGGWLMIAAYVLVLPMQFQTFGNAINTGRVLMLMVHIANVLFLFQIAYRLSGSRLAAFVACFFFNFSPLAVFYQREVLLDNLMVFWVLFSVYLLTKGDGRIVTAALSGLTYGLAMITKENAIFFAPVIGYLLYRQVHGHYNRRFVTSYWGIAAFGPLSVYALYASLKNELLPSHLSFNLNSPPADHVALLYSVWWQLNRNQGGVLDPNSLFWRFSFAAWLPKDHIILIGGGIAMLIVLFTGRDRQRYPGLFVAGLLAASYSLYLVRGSVMLEFYVIPLLPFLALNLGLLFDHVTSSSGASTRALATAVLIGLLVLPFGGYVVSHNDRGQLAPADLYNVPQTPMQAEEVAYVRQNIPPSARIIMDDDIWADLHDRSPVYTNAHSHWKASGDPAIRDRLFHKDWHSIDYVVMSNKMRLAMEQNNGDGNESWILDAIDNHSTRIWTLKHGDVELDIYRVDNTGGGGGDNSGS